MLSFHMCQFGYLMLCDLAAFYWAFSMHVADVNMFWFAHL